MTYHQGPSLVIITGKYGSEVVVSGDHQGMNETPHVFHVTYILNLDKTGLVCVFGSERHRKERLHRKVGTIR